MNLGDRGKDSEEAQKGCAWGRSCSSTADSMCWSPNSRDCSRQSSDTTKSRALCRLWQGSCIMPYTQSLHTEAHCIDREGPRLALSWLLWFALVPYSLVTIQYSFRSREINAVWYRGHLHHLKLNVLRLLKTRCGLWHRDVLDPLVVPLRCSVICC